MRQEDQITPFFTLPNLVKITAKPVGIIHQVVAICDHLFFFSLGLFRKPDAAGYQNQ